MIRESPASAGGAGLQSSGEALALVAYFSPGRLDCDLRSTPERQYDSARYLTIAQKR
jgi:hypothetical protein